MSETPSLEVNCPACGKSFYPHVRVKEKVLCGKEKTPPEDKNYDPSDCRLYYICSIECAEDLEKNQAPESQKSRIQEFLEKVGDASSQCGMDENDVCHIIERITGRKEYPD